MPISDEVADLVQTLGNFYTEVDGEREEADESEVDSRPFTRPFANHAGNVHDQQCHNKSSIQSRESTVAQVDVVLLLILFVRHTDNIFWNNEPFYLCFYH